MLDLSEPGDNLESLMSYKEIGDFLYKKIRVLENKLSNAPASIPRGNAINKEPKEMRVELKKLCLEAYEKELIGHMYSMPGLSKGRLSTMERCLIDDKLAGAINIARDFF